MAKVDSKLSIHSHNPGNRISLSKNIAMNIIFIIYGILCVAPILLVIIISLTDETTILQNGYSFFPAKWSIKSYTYLLQGSGTIFHAYGVSIFVAIVGTLASVFVIALYAYPLSRSNFKYKGFFSFLAYFTMIFGGGLVPWVMIYSRVLKIDNTILVLIVPYLMNAWYVIILRTFMKQSVPEAVIESAKIDGAGEFRTLFVIVLPLCKAGLATIGLFAMLGYWNDWYLPLIFITDRNCYNIQYLLYKILDNIQFLSSTNIGSAAQIAASLPSEGARMAIAVFAIGPIVFAYPFFQKYFIQGLTVGSVKG